MTKTKLLTGLRRHDHHHRRHHHSQ